MAVETQIKKARKPRIPRAVTPLEASVLATLNEQRATNAAIRGVAKAIAGLTQVQAFDVLDRAIGAVERRGPNGDGEPPETVQPASDDNGSYLKAK